MIYLCPYVGDGTNDDPFVPKYAFSGWTAIDIRPDPKSVKGYCILSSPKPIFGDPEVIELGDKDDVIASKSKSDADVAISTDVSNVVTCSDYVREVLLTGCAGKINPLQPRLDNGMVEIWLDNRKWFEDKLGIAKPAPMDPSDNFPTTGLLGGNWTTVTGLEQPNVFSANVVRDSTAVGGVDAASYWNADAWPADQWSEVAIITAVTSGTRYGGAHTRVSTSANTSYAARALGPLGAAGARNLEKIVAGARTVLASSGGTITSGDIIRCESQGSTQRYLQNGTQIHSVTDSAIASGNAGIVVHAPNAGTTADVEIGSWQGGGFGWSRLVAGERNMFAVLA